jgi:cobalt-precorrin-7 (C5)-methyltransferase
MKKIALLAVGPGSPQYLTPAVVEEAGKCAVLIGGKRNLALFAFPGQEKIAISGKIDPLMAMIREKMGGQKIGILLSGDSGIYSLLPRMVREFGRENLDVYPGISAVQYMFARLGLTWEDARFVSLHGRDPGILPAEVRSCSKVAVFTDRQNSPAALCRLLVEDGIKNKVVFIGEDLSYPGEKISMGRAEDFLSYSGSDLNLVVIISE